MPANDAGVVDPKTPMGSMSILLQPTAAQKADLAAFLADVQNHASANFHKFLTPQQFADRFGVSQNDLAQVSGWLASHGLTVDGAARGGLWVRFHGTAAQVQEAFGTEIHNYTINGVTHYANQTAPAVPASLGPMVAAIHGLHSVRMKPLAHILPRPQYENGGGIHYLSPQDISTIYNFAPLAAQNITGTGQTIAIVGTTDITVTDFNSFRQTYGLPAANVQQVLVGADPGTDTNAQFEADLDLQWAGAIAPGASLLYVYDQSVEDAVAYIVDNQLAPIISSSYQEGNFGASNSCDAADYVPDALYQQGIAQYANSMGITWVNASGDTGAAGCELTTATIAAGGRSPGLPAAIPEVTAVGGTEFMEGSVNYWNSSNTANGGSAKSYIPEMAWNDTNADQKLSASGGGASVLFAKPLWQTGPGVPADGARDVPDISFAASDAHDPYLICYQGCTSYVAGGTSVSAPIFAGLIALMNQYTGSNSQGNVNPALYQMAQSVPSAFHDVTVGDNIVPCASGSPDCSNGYLGYAAGPGYDLVTGLGSLDAFTLISNWKANGSSVTTSTTLNAPTGLITLNSNILVTATVKATSGTNTPTGIVTFRIGQNNSDGNYWQLLGSAPVSGSGGTATANFNLYPGQFGGSGSFAITAVYSGDGGFQSSGDTKSISLNYPSAKNAAVQPYVIPSAISPSTPDADGYRYFFQVGVTEINGVSTSITDLQINGVSYAPQLATLFGGTNLPAYGSIMANIRWNPPTAPFTTTVQVSGTDAAGFKWVQQTPLVVTGRQLAANLVLTSDPEPVYGNPAVAGCQWSQQLALYETGGRPVFLQNFYYYDQNNNKTDYSGSIQTYFGTTRLAPFGLAVAHICFTSNPGTLQWEVDAVDDLGNPTSGTMTSHYNGSVTNAAPLTVNPAAPVLNLSGVGQTTTTTLNVSVGSANQPWSLYTYPVNRTTSWLTVYPSSGYGNTTVTLTANSAGLAPGVYSAQLAVSGANYNGNNTAPGVTTIPVVMTVGQTGPTVANGLQNAASFTQSYAPGMLMAVYGTNLAPSTVLASNIPLPTNLAGVSATVNGVAAPLWFVSPSQINLQIPYETGAGTAVVGINNNGNVSYQTFQVQPTAPGIFFINGAINPDATAKVGQPAFLYLTGDGDVTPPLATGTTPATGTQLSSLPKAIAPLTVTVGGIQCQILFNGIVPGDVGVTQVNFQLPAGLTGTQPVVVTSNGVASQPVNITITN